MAVGPGVHMHILYLHQYFTPPDGMGSTRSYEMARRLHQAGHQVTMITSSAFFPAAYKFDRLVTDFEIDGIRLKVIRLAYSNRQSFARRMLAFIAFAILCTLVSLSVRGVEVVFATSTPLTIMIPGIAAKWRHGAPMVFEIRDQWPKAPIALGVIKNRLLIAAARWMERTAYHQAAHIVALSPTMKDGVVGAGAPPEKVTVIPNSADTDLFRVTSMAGRRFLEDRPYLQNKKLVAYTGTLGLANGVDYLVRLAARMRELDPTVSFVIAGDGAKRDELHALARTLGVYGKNLWMLAPLPKREVPALLSAATAACSTFVDTPIPWPNSANKFFDALAAGKPIIINHRGWQKDVLDRTGAGIVLPPDKIDEAAHTLKNFLDDEQAMARAANAATHLADTIYNRETLAEKLRTVLEQTTTSARRLKLS